MVFYSTEGMLAYLHPQFLLGDIPFDEDHDLCFFAFHFNKDIIVHWPVDVWDLLQVLMGAAIYNKVTKQPPK